MLLRITWPELKSKDLQTRWDIVKRHRLCHVCTRQGHHRGRCETQSFCLCGSDKRHHRLLHNPSRRDTAETNEGSQTRQGEPKPAENQRNGEQPSTTEPRSTVQYTTVEHIQIYLRLKGQFFPRKLNNCFWRGKHDLIYHRKGIPVNTILLLPSAHSMADARHNTLFSALNIRFRLQNRLLFCTETKI